MSFFIYTRSYYILFAHKKCMYIIKKKRGQRLANHVSLYHANLIVCHIIPDLRLGHVPIHSTRQHTMITTFQIDQVASMRHILHRLRIDEYVERIILVDVLRIAWLVDVPDISHG